MYIRAKGIKVKEILEKIRSKDARIVVVGLGHVGLPMAAIFANAGFYVTGIDIKKEIVKSVSTGRSHVKEHGLSKLIERVVKNGKLKASTGMLQAVKKADITMISVQTPLTKNKEPDLAPLENACKAVAKGLSKGKLVVVISTLLPGATRNLVAKRLEEGSRLECGRDFLLAYCPERIAPGKAIQEFMENSRIIGGFNRESAEIAAELFKLITKGEMMVTDCATAEVAKLAENTFRDVNIGFANELALICEKLGVDVIEVIRLANTHPRVAIHNPSCGVGGPCLPKDPLLLLHPVRQKEFTSRLISPSRELNEYMPKHTVKLVLKALKETHKDIKKAKITVLGVAYKGEVEDTRNSPAEKIIHDLINLGASVKVYDPFSNEDFGAERTTDTLKAVKNADCLVIVTDHNVFRELDLQRIRGLMNEKPVIVDGRRVLNPEEAKKQGFSYFGVGYI